MDKFNRFIVKETAYLIKMVPNGAMSTVGVPAQTSNLPIDFMANM